MSERKTTLVSMMRPHRTDREILGDVVRAVDGLIESHERLTLSVDLQNKQLHTFGTTLANISGDLSELAGHVMRADAAVRDGSSHDLEQDAKLAALHVRVETVETGWQKAGRHVVEFFESSKTRTVGRVVFGAAVTYLIGKDTGLLHYIAVALQGSGVLP